MELIPSTLTPTPRRPDIGIDQAVHAGEHPDGVECGPGLLDAMQTLAAQHPASRAVNPADPGSAAAMFEANPARKHPAEVVLGALLRGRPVDLPDGIAYRLGDDLSLGRVGIGSEEDGYVLIRDLTLGEFLRLCAQIPFNDLFVIGCDAFMAQDAVEQRRARARLERQGAVSAAPAGG